MSDRINTITVVLQKDVRDDDCEHICNALAMVKGVLSVKPHVADSDSYMAEARANAKYVERILKAIHEP